MATYSKYGGTNHYAVGSTLLLLDSSAQSYTFTENKVFTDLLDNTSKLIYPDRLRSAMLSLYDSIPFKETLVGSTYYIGIDSNDQNLKSPIYIGNRTYGATDLATSATLATADVLLNSTNADVDAYTKTTVVALLAGTEVALMKTAPKIDARIVVNNDLSDRIDLSFVNPNGQINVLSKQPADSDPGYVVTINGIGYPTIQDSGASASDAKILSYDNGAMVWSETIPYDPGYYGSTGSTVPIVGQPTYVNGYPLDFTESMRCPINLGGVSMGQTFSNKSLENVLESIVYGYMPPSCTLTLVNQSMAFSEVGTSPQVSLLYTVTKKTLDTKPIALRNMRPNQLAPIVSDVSTTISGNAVGVVITPIEKKTTVFEIVSSDGLGTTSASASVTGIYPFFCGLTSSNTLDTFAISTLNKLVKEKGVVSVDVFRSGIKYDDILYFVYDYEYGPLASVYDPNGNEILGGFNVETVALSSPEGLWASKLFYVYSLASYYGGYIGPFTVSSLFTFNF